MKYGLTLVGLKASTEFLGPKRHHHSPTEARLGERGDRRNQGPTVDSKPRR